MAEVERPKGERPEVTWRHTRYHIGYAWGFDDPTGQWKMPSFDECDSIVRGVGLQTYFQGIQSYVSLYLFSCVWGGVTLGIAQRYERSFYRELHLRDDQRAEIAAKKLSAALIKIDDTE